MHYIPTIYADSEEEQFWLLGKTFIGTPIYVNRHHEAYEGIPDDSDSDVVFLYPLIGRKRRYAIMEAVRREHFPDESLTSAREYDVFWNKLHMRAIRAYAYQQEGVHKKASD